MTKDRDFFEIKYKTALEGFREADRVQLRFRYALKILGCTNEEIETFETTEGTLLEEESNQLFGQWKMNKRAKAYFDDIKKYGIEEADRRDEFRAKAITFLGHGMTREELINEWKKH